MNVKYIDISRVRNYGDLKWWRALMNLRRNMLTFARERLARANKAGTNKEKGFWLSSVKLWLNRLREAAANVAYRLYVTKDCSTITR